MSKLENSNDYAGAQLTSRSDDAWLIVDRECVDELHVNAFHASGSHLGLRRIFLVGDRSDVEAEHVPEHPEYIVSE